MLLLAGQIQNDAKCCDMSLYKVLFRVRWGWVMQGWGGSCRGVGGSCRGGVGHVWWSRSCRGHGGMGNVGVEWVIQGWGRVSHARVGWVM